MFHQDARMVTGIVPQVARVPAELTDEEKKKGAQIGRSPCSAGQNSSCGGGCMSCMRAHVATSRRSTVSEPARASRTLLNMQRALGNQYVLRMVARAGESGGAEAGPAIEEAIRQKRGDGQPLDSGVLRQMESSFRADFSGVRVHDNAHAHDLNRALNARAFTTGSDIFFSAGSYRPGTSGGRELLAHELTHVVQQTGDGIRTKMTVSEPGDLLEREADQVAKSVIQSEHQPGEGGLQRDFDAVSDEEKKKKH